MTPPRPGLPLTNPSGYDLDTPLRETTSEDRDRARWNLACAAVRCGNADDLRTALTRLELL